MCCFQHPLTIQLYYNPEFFCRSNVYKEKILDALNKHIKETPSTFSSHSDLGVPWGNPGYELPIDGFGLLDSFCAKEMKALKEVGFAI